MKLSKSRIFSFAFCPKQFEWTYIKGYRQPETQAMLVGTRIHEFFDRFFDHYNKVKNWADLIPEDMCSSERDMIYFFFNYEKARLKAGEEIFKPLFREEYVETDEFLGYIDRVDDLGDGNVRLVEYKTGKTQNPSRIKQEMQFYRLLFEAVHPEYKVTQFRIYYPKLQEVVDYPVDSRSMTYLLKRIEKMKKCIEAGEYKVDCNLNKWFACGLCELEDIADEMF